MPPSGSKRLNDVLKAFTNIGETERTKFPEELFVKPKDARSNKAADEAFNKEVIVWEYCIAHNLEKAAKARKDLAKEALSEAGILPDNLAPNTEHPLHSGSTVILIAKTSKNVERANITAFASELRKAGVPAETIEKCLDKATTEGKPQTNLIPTFIV